MKLVILLLFATLFSSACKNDSSKTSGKTQIVKAITKKSNSKPLDFDCESFFKKGNYASICFINSKLPEYISAGCIFDFKTKGDKHHQEIKAQFVRKGSSMLAEMHFNLNRNNYKKGTVIEINNLGNDAFFDVHKTDLKSLSRSSKDLHVRFNNVTFALMADYQTNTEQPCFYNDKALIDFAQKIIDNL